MSYRVLPPEVFDGVVDRVARLLREELASLSVPPGQDRTPEPLRRAAGAIREARGQVDTLRALLAGTVALGGRAALFVVKPDAIEGWECSGFEDDPAGPQVVRGARLSRDLDAVSEILTRQTTVPLAEEGPYPPVSFGQQPRGAGALVPLRVQDKLAAVLYADPQSPGGELDVAGLETLAQCAGMAIERQTLSRLLQRTGETTGPRPVTAAPVASAEPRPAPAAPEPAAAAPPASTARADENEPSAGVASPEIQDARRFARLLMEEICLYHADKVDEGRAHRDLLARLSDEVDKARRMYDQRVAPEIRNRGDFFDEAVVRVLAGGDPNALGAASHHDS